MHASSWLQGVFAACLLFVAQPALAQGEPAEPHDQPTPVYEENEITHDVADFFGVTTETAAKVVEKVFSELGQPNAYIAGEEGSGAFVFGLRYGKGQLFQKGMAPLTVYWQGPSVGFDFGGNGSKCFTLVYNLPNQDAIFRRFPGAEGTIYFIAGIGVNYQQNGDVILAPMRTGLGIRAGVNAGYLSYSRERDWLPL